MTLLTRLMIHIKYELALIYCHSYRSYKIFLWWFLIICIFQEWGCRCLYEQLWLTRDAMDFTHVRICEKHDNDCAWWNCQALVRSPKFQSPKVKTKRTWADTKITSATNHSRMTPLSHSPKKFTRWTARSRIWGRVVQPLRRIFK